MAIQSIFNAAQSAGLYENGNTNESQHHLKRNKVSVTF